MSVMRLCQDDKPLLTNNEAIRLYKNRHLSRTANSLGLPRVSISQSPNYLIHNCQTKVYGGLSAGLRYIKRKSDIEGTTKNQEGATDMYTVYLYLENIRCLD